jgi:dUTP pyrophosphatase
MQTLKIKVDPECCNKDPILPPAKPGDVGYDLVSWIPKPLSWPHGEEPIGKLVIQPGEMKNIPVGVSIKLPPGTWGSIRPRSSTFAKRQLFVMGGTIDEQYIGPLYIYVWNPGPDEHVVVNGDRLAQLVIMPKIVPAIEVTDDLGASERGVTGFGSTGT